MKFVVIVSIFFFLIQFNIYGQSELVEEEKWELRLSLFHYLNSHQLGVLDNGSSISTVAGSSVALTIGRRIRISDFGNLSLVPRIGAEFYPSSKIKLDLTPPTLLESSELTFLQDDYVYHDFNLGIRLGLDFYYQLRGTKWSVYGGGGGLLWLPIDDNSELRIGAPDDFPYKRVKTSEQYMILLGRLDAGVTRQFTINDAILGVSLGYLKSFKSNKLKETHYLRENEHSYQKFEYQRAFDAIELSLSIYFG